MRLFVLMVLLFAVSVPTFADVLGSDDFEDSIVGEFPMKWQVKDGVTTDEFAVVDSPVKNGSKALKINSLVNDNCIWLEFGKSVTVASVEFWIYPEQEGRSATLLMLNGSIDRATAGPYISWGQSAGMITRYTGGWGPTNTPFDAQVWTYTKIVADSDVDTLDIYLGGGPDELPDVPTEAGITYRVPTDGFDRILWLGWSDAVGPAYIDDVLVYEGDERPAGAVTAVEPVGKAATTWGAIRANY